MKALENYDPNIQWSRQTVALTFMQWNYRLVLEVEVLGNCKGYDIFSSAISTCFDKIFAEDDNYAVINLSNISDKHDILEVTLESEEDLMRMCTSISIINHIEEE